MVNSQKLNYEIIGNLDKIEINISSLPKNIRVKNAFLVLKVKNVTENASFDVNFYVDSTNQGLVERVSGLSSQESQNQIYLNVTNVINYLVRNNLSVGTLKFEGEEGNIIQLEKVDDKAKVDYLMPSSFEENATSYKVNLSEACSGNINLSSGELSVSSFDAGLSCNAISLPIYHVYNSNGFTGLEGDFVKSLYGENFKLSLERYIKEEVDENGKSTHTYTYIDENGKEERLSEKFYYLDNNENKVYVEPTDERLSQNVNGELEYILEKDGESVIKEVKSEFKTPTGLTLVTSKKDIKGAGLTSTEPDELVNLREQIKSLENSLENLENTIESSKKQLLLLALSKRVLKKQNKIQECSTFEETVATEAQKEIYQNVKSLNDINSIFKSELGSEEYSRLQQVLEKNHDDFMLSEYFEELKVEEGSVKLINKDLLSSEMQIENMLITLESYFEQLKSTNDTLKKLYNEKAIYERQVPSFYLYNDDVVYGFSPIITETSEVVTNKNSESDASSLSVSGQNMPIMPLGNSDAGIEEIDIISSKEQEIGTSYTAAPHIFRLNYIADNWENAIVINFEPNSNKIENIVDSANHIVSFEYNDEDLLTSITDENEKTTKFSYDEGGRLVEINEARGLKSKFIYENDKLTSVLAPNGLGAKFTYSDGRVVSVQNLSNLEKIEDGKSVFKFEDVNAENIDSMLLGDVVKFNYKTGTSTILTSLKSENGIERIVKTLVYVFDSSGRVVSAYENAFSDTNASTSQPNVVSFSYSSKEEKMKVTPLVYSKNYLMDKCFTNGGDVSVEEVSNFLASSLLEGDDLYLGDELYLESYLEHKNYHSFDVSFSALTDSVVVDSSLLGEINDNVENLVLSGFAKANSLFVVNLDNTDNEISDFPTYLQNRKFELRAEISYSDGTKATFSKNFDYKNIDWQFVCVPVSINKSKVVTEIKCYFDYSNNFIDTPVYFTDLTLREAKVDTQIYENKKVVESFSSLSKWRSEYKYNTDDKLVEVDIFDKTKENESNYKPLETKYFYNKNGKVYKVEDYNGIVTENEFNDNGVIIKTKKYHKNNSTDIMFSEENLDENGNVTSSVNSLGKTLNTYSYAGDKVESVTDSFGNITSYGYDEVGNTLEMTSTENGVSNTNTYEYTLDFLTSVSHNNFDINYDYNKEGRVSKIKVDGEDYVTLAHDNMSNSSVMTYTNNESFKCIENDDGNVTEVLYSDSSEPDYTPLLQNVYDTHGSLIQTNDLVTNSTTKYFLDKFGNVAKTETTQHGLSIEKNSDYDDNGNETFTEYTFGGEGTGEGYGYSYEFDTMSPDNALRGVILPTSALESVSRDRLGRTKEITLTPSMEAETKATRLFHYLKSGNHTSNQVSSIWFGDNEKYLDNLRYTYDDKGNILEVKENGVVIARYQYDGLSRLVREDNKPMSKTTTYEYDAGGNISCRAEYAFTLSPNLDEKEPVVIIPYTYASSGNRDRLMSYDGENFTYDVIGNPTKYRDVALTWEKGRQLKKYASIEYFYNAHGIRTKKVNGNAVTEYYLDGSRILAQKDIVVAGDNTQVETTMHFIYGLDGVTGFTLNNQNYYYKKNLQGDIIGIYDNNLNLIVKYDYDAWGEHKIYYLDNGNFVDLDFDSTYTNISNTNLYIALKNPFRYRSYYYDLETGLYYLNSRYYDSEICRFINADDISVLDITKIALNGINLYAYCLNNPVNEVDEGGAIMDSFSDIFDILFALLEVGVDMGVAIVERTIKTAARPKNIGVGIFIKQQHKQLLSLSKISKVVSKVSSVVAWVSVGFGVVEGIINDLNQNYSTGRIVSNTVVNTVVYGGMTLASGYIGSQIGSLIGSVVPGFGNVIGAAVGFVTGLALGWILDLQINGKTIIDHIKDGIYDFWRWLFG